MSRQLAKPTKQRRLKLQDADPTLFNVLEDVTQALAWCIDKFKNELSADDMQKLDESFHVAFGYIEGNRTRPHQ